MESKKQGTKLQVIAVCGVLAVGMVDCGDGHVQFVNDLGSRHSGEEPLLVDDGDAAPTGTPTDEPTAGQTDPSSDDAGDDGSSGDDSLDQSVVTHDEPTTDTPIDHHPKDASPRTDEPMADTPPADSPEQDGDKGAGDPVIPDVPDIPDLPLPPEEPEDPELPPCVQGEEPKPAIELLTKSFPNTAYSEVRYSIQVLDCHDRPIDLRGLVLREWYYPVHYLTSLDRDYRRSRKKPYRIEDADSGATLVQGRFGLHFFRKNREHMMQRKYQWYTLPIQGDEPVYHVTFSYNVELTPFWNGKIEYWGSKGGHDVTLHTQIGDYDPVDSAMYLEEVFFNGWFSVF